MLNINSIIACISVEITKPISGLLRLTGMVHRYMLHDVRTHADSFAVQYEMKNEISR